MKLTPKARENLKKSKFGLPKEKKYPITDVSHAINAKARATQMLKKGKLSESARQEIDKKANALLRKLKIKKMDKNKTLGKALKMK